MKKIIGLLACCCLIFSLTVTGTLMNAGADADFSKSPKEFVSGIKVGWNLGNTFDCYTEGVGPYEQETSWNNKQATTQEMIAKVAESGFNAIRIPISWGSQVT
ncbi:MAG: cellulase family glycosylhydrolase, partial [Acutalibacteraceae bacterium]